LGESKPTGIKGKNKSTGINGIKDWLNTGKSTGINFMAGLAQYWQKYRD
jgi:ribosome biogenesis GTPase A